MYACITHTHTRTHTRTHARTHKHTHTHTQTHRHTHACTHARTHKHTHIHARTHTYKTLFWDNVCVGRACTEAQRLHPKEACLSELQARIATSFATSESREQDKCLTEQEKKQPQQRGQHSEKGGWTFCFTILCLCLSFKFQITCTLLLDINEWGRRLVLCFLQNNVLPLACLLCKYKEAVSKIRFSRRCNELAAMTQEYW